MSVELGTDKGIVGQFASGMGYSELIAAAGENEALKPLFDEGYLDGKEAVSAAVKALNDLADTSDKTVADTANGLAEMMDGEDLVFITSGVVDGSDGDDSDEVIGGYIEKATAATAIDSGFEAKPGAVSPNPVMEDELYDVVNRFFASVDLAKSISGLDLKKDDEKESAAITDAVLASLNAIDWSRLAVETEPILARSASAGVSSGMDQVNVTDGVKIARAQKLAATYAEARAAEMVGKKWVDGDLVDNPNARWAISQTTRDEIQKIVADALAEHTTMKDLTDRIKQAGTFSESRARMIAATEVAAAQTRGNVAAWKTTGVVKKVRWVVSADHTEPDECTVNANAGPVDFGKAFPSGDEHPPQHPRCFSGDAVVSASGVSSYYKRWFDGEVVIICIPGMADTTVTPNHPILTRRGWVKAGLLKIGDSVLQCVDPCRGVDLLNPYDNHMETRIDEMANSLLMTSEMVSISVPSSTEAFHGDGSVNGEIDIVRATGQFSDRGELVKRRENEFLRSVQRRGIMFDGGSMENLGFEFDDRSARRSVSRSGNPLSFYRRHSAHADNGSLMRAANSVSQALEGSDNVAMVATSAIGNGFGGFSSDVVGVKSGQLFRSEAPTPDGRTRWGKQCEASGLESTGYNGICNTNAGRYGMDGFSGLVVPVKISKIWNEDFHGYVHNVETDSGFYMANSMIVHNCRCVLRIEKIE